MTHTGSFGEELRSVTGRTGRQEEGVCVTEQNCYWLAIDVQVQDEDKT